MTDKMATIPIPFSEWELAELRSHAASNYLTYAGHHANGLEMTKGELRTMERWKRLADKLDGKPTL